MTLQTTGQIAKELGTSRDTVQNIVRAHGIKPDSHAGCYGLFARAAVAQIAAEVERRRKLRTPEPAVTV
ncbi:MAG TPA: hypothetical protein VM008_22400 [Phycisphaerae bacterium]|nr:hypothetical protein [Phycisphaerae bacterium]